VLLVKMRPKFGVAMASKDVAARFEVPPQCIVFIKLTIGNDPPLAALVRDGLRPMSRIDEREPTGSKRDSGFDMDSLAIGAAMGEGTHHSAEPIRIEKTRAFQVQYARNSTHGAHPIPSEAKQEAQMTGLEKSIFEATLTPGARRPSEPSAVPEQINPEHPYFDVPISLTDVRRHTQNSRFESPFQKSLTTPTHRASLCV
jgi:hypothetical protein